MEGQSREHFIDKALESLETKAVRLKTLTPERITAEVHSTMLNITALNDLLTELESEGPDWLRYTYVARMLRIQIQHVALYRQSSRKPRSLFEEAENFSIGVRFWEDGFLKAYNFMMKQKNEDDAWIKNIQALCLDTAGLCYYIGHMFPPYETEFLEIYRQVMECFFKEFPRERDMVGQESDGAWGTYDIVDAYKRLVIGRQSWGLSIKNFVTSWFDMIFKVSS